MTQRLPSVAALLLALALAGPGYAQDSPEAVEKRLEGLRDTLEQDQATAEALEAEARRQAEELSDLRSEMQAAANAAREHERAIGRLEGELADLAVERRDKEAALQARRAQLGDTLGALQRLSLRPAAALLVSPGDPNDVVRSGLLLRTAVPRIEDKARALRDDLAELAALSERISARRAELAVAGDALSRERAKLSELVNAKNSVLRQTRSAEADARARIEELSGEARTLGELLERLEAQRAAAAAIVPKPKPARPDEPAGGFVTPKLAPAGTPSIAGARGRLTQPAHGEVVQEFGRRTEFGGEARGVTWRTRPGTSVLAPWDGRIVFSGPFRRFGQILIIEHGEGYHSLIAGLARVDAQVGQWVLAGEPVGITGNGEGDDPETAGGRTNGGRSERAEGHAGGPTLYVEFRHDGQPINPLPWMAARTDRIHG